MTESRFSRVRGELATFADLGSLNVDIDQRTMIAEWTIDRRKMEAIFFDSMDGIKVTVGDSPQVDYKEFLASSSMANLVRVAQMIRYSAKKEMYVPTRLRIQEDEPTDAIQSLTDRIQAEDEGRTNVIMITGELGAGKTRLLKELVRRQSNRYLEGEDTPLLLYINAQGRALARFNEALAIELQDLRVGLTYHSIACLTRLGLIIPVIDGFDELLAVTGYDDSFSSLAIFLDQLGGEGAVVASARSIYYQEEFVNRATEGQTHEPWQLVTIGLCDWEEEEQEEFLTQFSRSNELNDQDRLNLKRTVDRLFEGHTDLRSKPFFLQQVADLARENRDQQDRSMDLLSTIADQFIERERQQKLLDRNACSILSRGQVCNLISQIAEEMWHQETRELDFRSVKLVAESVLDETDCDESQCKIVLERIRMFAFFSTSSSHGTIMFEHEVFFSYFLSLSLASYLLKYSDMRPLLSRSPLPDLVASRVAQVLQSHDIVRSNSGLEKLLTCLGQAGGEYWFRGAQVRRNSGMIVLAMLNGEYNELRTVRDLKFQALEFDGGELDNIRFVRSEFNNVIMRHTNLCGARFLQCTAREFYLTEVVVDKNRTRLELNGVSPDANVFGLTVYGEDGPVTLYRPTQVSRILSDCGMSVMQGEMKSERDISDDTINLVTRLLRLFQRTNFVSLQDPRIRSIARHHRWKEVLKSLKQNNIIEPQKWNLASKRGIEYYRIRYRVSAILEGQSISANVSQRIAGFWDALESKGL